MRDLHASPILSADEQLKLGHVVDYVLNGNATKRRAADFFVMVRFRDPDLKPEEANCLVSSQPVDEMLPMILDWLKAIAPEHLREPS
jgi:hypothetical protein